MRSCALLFLWLAAAGGNERAPRLSTKAFIDQWRASSAPRPRTPASSTSAFGHALSEAALERTRSTVRYEAAYVPIAYPEGDVPADTGVCTDEVVRTYRKLGIDLQKEVHEDMAAAFEAYPRMWGLTSPDANIDHRRVPNLMTFFARHGHALPVTTNPSDYQPGDLIVWVLSNGLLHTGMVVEPMSADGQRHLVVHNIGEGPKLEDAFDVGTRVAHFRYEKPR